MLPKTEFFNSYSAKKQYIIDFFHNMSRNSRTSIKNARTNQSPQQFVTVQIHNQNVKNKYRIHRSSVLSELRATESILNQSLNKNSSIHQSNFLRLKRNSTSEKSFKLIPQSKFSKKRLITETEALKDSEDKTLQYQMRPQIRQKFIQLSNISYQLEKACESKKKGVNNSSLYEQMNYTLPIIEQTKVQKENNAFKEHLKFKKRWKQKIKMGKKCIEHLKKNPTLYNLLKHAKEQELAPVEQDKSLKTPQALRDAYILPLPYQRKSAPISSSSTHFFNLFCSHKQQNNNLYSRKVELQPLLNLQQFANGGEQNAYKDYSEYINLTEFIKTREKMTFLKRMYNFVKQKYGGSFKQMKEQTLQDPNLLSLVYYNQNNINLTQQEKKNLRKRLKFIE